MFLGSARARMSEGGSDGEDIEQFDTRGSVG